MTLALALWGAVLSTVGIVVQLIRVLRDRPTLAVKGDLTITRGGPYEAAVEVANRGSQATTVMEVGLEVSGGDWTARFNLDENTVRLDSNETLEHRLIPIIRLSAEGDARLVQPGEVVTYPWAPTTASLFPIDSPLRPYAIDSHGRIAWSRAQPFYRWFYNAGWRPVNDDPGLHSDRPLYVAPVAPIWQVWKPRALRGSWRRRRDYRTRWRRKAMRTTLTEREAHEAGDAPRVDA
jgi:hypothetical protein